MTAHIVEKTDTVCQLAETLPSGNVAYTRHEAKWTNDGFLYPSGNIALVMRGSAKRPPLRIMVDALRQLRRLGALGLQVVPQFLQGVELAGGMGEEAWVFGGRHIADEQGGVGNSILQV